MTSRFADASWFLALLGPDDQYHDAAIELAAGMGEKILTTEFVLLEVVNFLSGPSLRPRVRPFIRSLETDRHTTVVPASSELLSHGLRLFLDRPDKTWSLTDCTSFVLMRENGITEALTADHHFEQAGFVALLRSSG